MNTDLDTLRLFVRVARRNSFSAAARDLSLPQSSVSRQIARLEQDLGTALFSRSTRSVVLTEAGRKFLERIDPILDAIDEAEHEARGDGELRGILRVGLSSSMAIREILPRLPEFLALHPALRIELAIDDEHQDIIADGMDLAIRFGALADSSVIARKLKSWPLVLAASPAYLQRFGYPSTPADLAHHHFVMGPNWRHGILRFTQNGNVASMRIEPRLTVSLNEAATSAALAGLGIVNMSLAGCRGDLAEGRLIRLLEDWSMDAVDLHAVFSSGRATKRSARAFADFLAAAFREVAD